MDGEQEEKFGLNLRSELSCPGALYFLKARAKNKEGMSRDARR